MIKIVPFSEANAVTHAGTFHADDVFATVLLEKLYGDIDLARVNEVGETDAFVYDIGFGHYDHHQSDKAVRSNGIHYSSVGLIWADYGRTILKQAMVKDEDLEDFWYELDDCLFMPIDAFDNGESRREAMTISPVISLLNPFWNDTHSRDEMFLKAVDMARIIFDNLLEGMKEDAYGQGIDYDWGYEWLDQWLIDLVLKKAEDAGLYVYTEEGNAVDLWKEYGEDILVYEGCKASCVYNVAKGFIEPLTYERRDDGEVVGYPIEMIAIIAEYLKKGAGADLLAQLFQIFIDSERSRCQSISYVEQQIDLSKDHIIILEVFSPWKGTVSSSLSQKAKEAVLVVFPSSRGGWNYQGIPVSPGSFDVRCRIPKEWLGKRDQDLVDVTGIKDASFVHPEGFIGGALSFAGIMEMAHAIVYHTLGK